ncbi:MAG: hypothetical protein HY042_00615 [Spirochaetia bacterium]|nr:hypothetical protein [Spirochaetia bacterium]
MQFRRKDLPDYGVALFVPAEWSLRRGDFFHATASGKIPNGQNGTMDYRGIEKVKKDFQSRALYATGWYEAVSRNYPGWKFETRSTSPQDPEGTFEFEGTYRQGAVIYRKIGRLRFRGDRVHAFYYTAPDDDFESSRKFFEDMDGRHRYFQPRS